MLDTDLSRDLQMQQENLTLSEAVDKARHKELVQTNFNVSNSVHCFTTPAMSKKSNNKKKSGPCQNQSKASKSGKNCQKYGYIHRSHRPDACPAIGKTCHPCNKLNHFASMCCQKVDVCEKRSPSQMTVKKNHTTPILLVLCIVMTLIQLGKLTLP